MSDATILWRMRKLCLIKLDFYTFADLLSPRFAHASLQ